MKSDRTLDLILYVLLFIIIAGDIALVLLQKISYSAALWTGVGSVLVIGLVLWLKNYRKSAYGGKFHERYPDSKN